MGISKVQPMRPALEACIDAINDGFDPYVQPYIDAAQQATAQAQAATVLAQAATQAAQDATEAAEDATEAAESAAASITDGYFPMVTAGAADGIKGGGPTVDGTFLQRVTGNGNASDGPATIEVIRGNTVRWNQLLSYQGGYTVDGNKPLTAGTSVKSGHVYVFKASLTVTEEGTANPYLALFTRSGGSNVMLTLVGGTNNQHAAIFTSQYDATATGSAGATDGNLWLYQQNSGATATFANTQLFDLTQMFGAGNEPSTVAEFEQMFPAEYYPYSDTVLLSVNMDGIESSDADGNVLARRSIIANNLRSAGTAYDELRESERITRIGVVDLGALTWTRYESNGVYAFRASIPGMVKYAVDQMPDLTCVKYPVGRVADTQSNVIANMPDKSISAHSGYELIFIRDDSYTDAAAFKTAMSGVMLYYELATPTTTTVDPPLNMSYRAEQGGTETVLVPDGEMSAPVPMVIVYGSTPDGILDRSAALLAAKDGPTATAYHAVGSYLTMNGKLYRVTTAIAIGETITSGTNVTETTVMEEVIRLTQ